jgi:hypothetical protein
MGVQNLKQIVLVPVEGKFSMQMAMECVVEKVKRLVGGRSCSLQCQALPKDKTNTLTIFNVAGMAHEVPGCCS